MAKACSSGRPGVLQLGELRREQFNLRMQKGSGQLTKTHQFGRVRREIAQIKTVLGSKK